jgi:xanthine dehydrogenase small subunit
MPKRPTSKVRLAPPRSALRFIFRGRPVTLDALQPRQTLLDWLRLEAGALGTKEGCAEGDCGACSVVLCRPQKGGGLSYEPVNACILLLGQVDGAEILTVEDLAEGTRLHPVQAALVEQNGSQCGFCTPGIVMSLLALYHAADQRPPTAAAIDEQLAGNLCRCTGYRPIVAAARQACAFPPNDQFTRRLAGRERAIRALDGPADLFVGTPARFFAAPRSEAALASLYARHPDALLVGGATDVGLSITKALADPGKIIWLGRVRGLDTLGKMATRLTLGAMLPLATAIAPLAGIADDFGAMLRRFGSVQVRASGTIGGNIANGSPIGDLAPPLIALGATLELRRGARTRQLPLEEFFLAYGKQDRGRGEYVRRLIVPRLGAGEILRIDKVSKRRDEDISCVLGAFRLTRAEGRISAARIAFGGMAGTPKRATAAEAAVVGLDLADEESWIPALDALASDYRPLDDMRGSAAYRTLIARNLLRKALMAAADFPEDRLRLSGRHPAGDARG